MLKRPVPRPKTKIAMVGTLPPPFGGVSVHVMRLFHLLREHRIPVTLYEQKGKSSPLDNIVPMPKSLVGFIWFLLSFQEQIVHFHFNERNALALAGLLMKFRRRKTYMITLHSEKPIREVSTGHWLYRQLLRTCFVNSRHIICVNQNIFDYLHDHLGIPSKRLSLIPAFLPPTTEEMNFDNIPPQVQEFVRGHEIIVGSHGWFGYFIDGRHVYGFELIKQLAEQFAEKRNVGIYTVISGCYDSKHRQDIMSANSKLSKNWMIIEDSFPCPALYQETDLFLRPTITDGDSVSIRECLSMGVPVLTSDAVPRPAQCELFKSGDYSDFSTRFIELIKDIENSRVAGNADLTPHLFGDKLLSVFHHVLYSYPEKGN
jgi:glycosyltransferase involved in cell wall biosynthesis